jgi:hypothetical protein
MVKEQICEGEQCFEVGITTLQLDQLFYLQNYQRQPFKIRGNKMNSGVVTNNMRKENLTQLAAE